MLFYAVSHIHKTCACCILHNLVIIRCHLSFIRRQPYHTFATIMSSMNQKTHVPWLNPEAQDCGM